MWPSLARDTAAYRTGGTRLGHRRFGSAATGLVGLALATLSCQGPSDSESGSAGPGLASYVGRDACTSCHQAEVEAWSESHHDLSMAEASAQSVLGDFEGASLTHAGETTTFSRRDDAFVVRTEGPDGILADFVVTHVFGAVPLQQYLIELPGGRLQALSVAWDSRAEALGGQRWFHLYPDEQIEAGDPLHWTAPAMNWNAMCAECHSTAVRKNYDLTTKSYETTWSEIDVSCEACHGPASAHIALAAEWADGEPATDLGFGGVISDPGGGWEIEPGATIAARTSPLPSNDEVETCAHCHARRSTIAEGKVPGAPLHDYDIVSGLEAGLYHADGQILDEVYVYGSFVQSKMYAAGVRCSDCHDPHSLELRAPGNALCSGCHLSSAYDTPEHHRHAPASTGAQCVECHMPATTYMVVDPRRDHSIRSPRPELSERFGVPNACNACHTGESVEWAVAAIETWFGEAGDAAPHFAEALDAGRAGRPGAGALLRAVALDPQQPGIVRATALGLMGSYPTLPAFEAIRLSSFDGDPMVRLGALSALDALPPDTRLQVAFRMLRDPVRAVRIEAARVLAPVPRRSLSEQQRTLLESVTAEYVEAQMVNADRAYSHVNLGNLHTALGVIPSAERAYRDALIVDSTFVPAYLNLADLYRATARDRDGEVVLREGLRVAPEAPTLHHAMGLLLARVGELTEATQWLTRAVELAPDQPRLAYVLGVALNSDGETEAAIAVLVSALARQPFDRDLLTLLTQLHRDRGERSAALAYAERLSELLPEDPSVNQLLSELRRPN